MNELSNRNMRLEERLMLTAAMLDARFRFSAPEGETSIEAVYITALKGFAEGAEQGGMTEALESLKEVVFEHWEDGADTLGSIGRFLLRHPDVVCALPSHFGEGTREREMVYSYRNKHPEGMDLESVHSHLTFYQMHLFGNGIALRQLQRGIASQ